MSWSHASITLKYRNDAISDNCVSNSKRIIKSYIIIDYNSDNNNFLSIIIIKVLLKLLNYYLNY